MESGNRKTSNVSFRISSETKIILQAIAQEKGFKSVSDYAKHRLTSDINYSFNAIKVTQEPAKKLSTYLYDHEIEALKKHCLLTSMSLSREIAFRVRSSLFKKEPCFYPQEIDELKKIRTAINKVGRNIHFLLTSDQKIEVNDPDFLKNIDELSKMNFQINNLIERLTLNALNRFG